jgi:DinB superfamily
MSYIEANVKGRERLRTLVGKLTDPELATQVGDGWNAAAILAHLAFWDYRVLVLLQRWRTSGVGPSPIDTDGVNDAMKPLCLAIPGREAVSLAVRAAETVDAELESLPEDLMAEIGALVQQGKFRLDRSIHRNQHLDQIQSALAESR